jgi:8-oxo-dGTP pyrophosphatase MutT (NUDIX family)
MNGRHQVLLVHRRAPRLWALPKGTPDSGETVEETAVRETREETGIVPEIEARLTSIRYYFVRGSTRFHKTVHFFLMRPVGGAIDDHDAEFDEVRWTDMDEAIAILSHDTERSVVEEAAAFLARAAPAGDAVMGEAGASA